MKKLLASVLVLSAVGYAVWPSHAPAPRKNLVQDRVWIDHLPRNDKDTINVFAALTQEPVGVFEATSAWRGQFEVFRYELSGNELRLVFPQTGDKEKVTIRARECSEGGMDYCLEVDGASHGVKRYYSREGWEIRNLGELELRTREDFR